MATSKDKSEALPESVRPRRQVRLPAYLSDYQVNVTSHRELASSYTADTAAQTTFRREEECSAESDGTARKMSSAGSASVRPGSQYSTRDEWGTFYAELEDIQAQLGQDTQLIRSLRDRVRQHVLTKCCGGEIPHADTRPLLRDDRVSSPATRQPLAHLSSPASFSASSQVSSLQSQVSAVSSGESHSVTHLTPQRLRTTLEVNPPPQEDESWPEPPPSVCDDAPYRAREEREFPVSYATFISYSNPVELAVERAVAQPYYAHYVPACVNSFQNPSLRPDRGDIRTNPISQDTQCQSSSLYPSLARPPTQAPYSRPYSTPWLNVAPPAQQQFMYAPRSVQQTEPWLKHSEMPYSQPQPSPYETFPTSLLVQEKVYLGPKPRIPMLVHRDPAEFARLKMSLENLLPADTTELFKYQILVDHLKLEEASLIADSYLNSATPYSDTMTALNERFGQPHQLALKRIAQVMDAPDIKRGDHEAFQRFALQIRALVGMLETLGVEGEVELKCGSHVARLLGKLPPELRADFRRHLYYQSDSVYTLPEFSKWLQYEAWCQGHTEPFTKGNPECRTKPARLTRPATVLHGAKAASQIKGPDPGTKISTSSRKRGKVLPYCPYCESSEHFLSQCATFQTFTPEQIRTWITDNKRCIKCGRSHAVTDCTLKKPCSICQNKHLQILHEVNSKAGKEGICMLSSAVGTAYLNRPTDCSRVLLKVVKVRLQYRERALETYAVLDDGSERTILLCEAADKLGLRGIPEELALRTIRQETQVLQGASVSFSVSSASQPKRNYHISGAFTAQNLGLADHSYPLATLQKRYRHLRGLPLEPFDRVSPLLLIGADQPHLITPTEPVRLGPPGGPVAIRTRLGWTLQGPARGLPHHPRSQNCYLTSVNPETAELLRNVEKLWQVDTLPFKSEKQVTRSREDQEALSLLESKTIRVEHNKVQHYATPLLRKRNTFPFHATRDAVMPSLRGTEKRLAKDEDKASAYITEISKLELAGSVRKLTEEEVAQSEESWFIPHHLVHHNGKNRLVFNCSYQFQGRNLNESLLPGPTLGPSLLGVLLRFREHAIAISGDIKAMFHQVCLLPEDKSLLRFVWRNLCRDVPPVVYEWQVLPFGTTCSPCCATFALQKHVHDHSNEEDDVRNSVDRCFYVDNCLQSLPSKAEAKELLDKLRVLLASGGFEIRQWASNAPEIISHLPQEARSDNAELWLTQNSADIQESTLGLRWHCPTDTIGYKHRLDDYGPTTMRTVYRTLAKQYDPLGLILPYTTRAKVIVQRLWDKQREWDDPLLPEELLQAWNAWVSELPELSRITLPRCYVPTTMDQPEVTREVHVFCDASDRAYGSVAYLRSEDAYGGVHLAFLLARSRVAPKRQQSMPRLELCAAVTGAQLAKLIVSELTLPIKSTILWSDSTTVLTWLRSDSCRFKVFVGTRIAEIQELTDQQSWRYVSSTLNPADDLTRGKSLVELAQPNRWCQGPSFLLQPPHEWPEAPAWTYEEDPTELRRSLFCHFISTSSDKSVPDSSQYATWSELVEATARTLQQDKAEQDVSPPSRAYQQVVLFLIKQSQLESFPEEYHLLKANKSVPSSSRLLVLAPEFDATDEIIRVGGRLRRAEDLDPNFKHPIVLDPSHYITKLLIQDCDQRLCHPGPERVFAELRRSYWILRGREAVRKHQYACLECRKLRSKPVVPKMADLPPARLRLFKPAFYSTGMDCFGPFQVKIGRRTEKRWGIIFKCLTTRAVHLDVLTSIDTDAFLMAVRRFTARRGTPAELYSDQGTNFRGGEKELREAFSVMSTDLQGLLAKHQINFHFNPPTAPHFGGVWEREIRSVKAALSTTIGAQSVPEEVLRTVLIEVEAILNSKPLGYVSSNISDVDPITPNHLLMGRPSGSFPQVVYQDSERLSRRRWRQSQILVDHFWAKFISYYLPGLQLRQKWQGTTADLTEGSVVMMVDPQLPRALWLVGKVVRVFPSADGHVRAAEVKVDNKSYTRPVVRLIKLPELPNDD